MKIYHFQPPDVRSNFGDALGPWLWNKMLHSDAANILPDTLFCGIGTMLNEIIQPGAKVIVFGAGAGYGPPPADISNWYVYFVRGPKTAKTLGIPMADSVTDPGILVSTLGLQKNSLTSLYGFMPRWSTHAEHQGLRNECESAGIKYVDPTEDVDFILGEIASVSCLVTEALHGAVVADALRVKWVPVIFEPGHEYKWFDWCMSMGCCYFPEDLRVNSLEWVVKNAEPTLSPDPVHQYNLEAVLGRLTDINTDILLRNGPFEEI